MKMCIFVHLLFSITYGALPISYPGVPLNGKKGIVPYNLIDAYPTCYAQGICPMFPPGGRLSAFPNSEEKYQMIMHNFFRNFANETLRIKYGKWAWGASTSGGRTVYCKGCKYCGETTPTKKPLYWFAPANYAARFKQYDENSCDQDWYHTEGQTFHSTCNWVLPEYGGGSHCDLFMIGGTPSCTMAMRNFAFCDEQDDCWFDTEGICGANTCVTDGHCEPIFADKYDYQGAGFVEGMNGAATVYSRKTNELTYLLPAAAHFDERMRLPYDERSPDRDFFTLMLQYFDANHTQTPVACYSLFKGAYHKMNVTVSEVGNFWWGYNIKSYSVIFTSIHKPIGNQCQPYAFICKTSLGNFVRLPEDGDYYFGTEWIDWKWSNIKSWNLHCKENHYYHDGTQWIVNGDPRLDRCDIWYYNDDVYNNSNYQSSDYRTCLGCSKLNSLDCWSQCIYSDFAPDSCQCGNEWSGPWYGNEWCDPALSPTPRPTDTTSAPTPSPTPAPVDPTPHPSRSPLPAGITYPPSADPTKKPSRSPLGYHQTHPPSPEPSFFYNNTGDSNEEVRSSPGGGYTALVVIILLVLIAAAVYVYWRKHDKKPLLPAMPSGALSLTKKRRRSSEASRESQTAESRSSRLQIPIPKASKPVKSYSMDVSDDEGGDEAAASISTKFKPLRLPKKQSSGKKQRAASDSTTKSKLSALHVPQIGHGFARTKQGNAVKSYSIDMDADTDNEADNEEEQENSGKKQTKKSKLSALRVPQIGFARTKQGKTVKSYSMDMDADTDNEADNEEEEVAIEFQSIEDAKKMQGGDKEKYLKEEDFVKVFEMTREQFYKQPAWKQKRAKQNNGFW